jgi:hypothetical protein
LAELYKYNNSLLIWYIRTVFIMVKFWVGEDRAVEEEEIEGDRRRGVKGKENGT